MTESDWINDRIRETEAGRLVKQEGKPHMLGPLTDGAWRGRPPAEDHCTRIPDFEAQQHAGQQKPDGFGGTKIVNSPLQMTTENLINAARNHAVAESEPNSLDFAVTFRVLLNGEYQGTWYGNRFGWRWTS